VKGEPYNCKFFKKSRNANGRGGGGEDFRGGVFGPSLLPTAFVLLKPRRKWGGGKEMRETKDELYQKLSRYRGMKMRETQGKSLKGNIGCSMFAWVGGLPGGDNNEGKKTN